MAEKSNLDDKKISVEDLEQVSGGTILETTQDALELYKRGLLESSVDCSAVRDVFHNIGYTGFKDKGGLKKKNTYTDKKGAVISRSQFWANFDRENGTSIIR